MAGSCQSEYPDPQNGTVPNRPRRRIMGWLFPIALVLAFLADLPCARAGDGTKERSIDELAMTAEVERSGDFMAWGFDALWMMMGETAVHVNGKWTSMGPALIGVDGKTNEVEDLALPGASASVRGLAIGEGAVWIPDERSEQIFKFDPESKKVVLTIPVPFSGTEGSIGVGEGAVWITARSNVLTRFNATTGAVEASIKLNGSAPAVVVADGS